MFAVLRIDVKSHAITETWIAKKQQSSSALELHPMDLNPSDLNEPLLSQS